jgi:hypothetical protein
MKWYIIVLIGLSILTSCSKEAENKTESITNCQVEDSTYGNSNNTYIHLKTQEWYLKNHNSFMSVKLLVSGSSNGDSITIRTYGDGLIMDAEIELNPEKEFEKDITISFTAAPVTGKEFTPSTKLIVYKDSDTLNVDLQGCTLRY